MAVYTFINGVRKTIFTYNPRVIVNGNIKKIIAGYTFINGVRYILFSKWSFDHTEIYTSPINSINQINLTSPGKYLIVCRGGGGNGGNKGGDTVTGNNNATSYGGAGGCGGKGNLTTQYITINTPKVINCYVGGGGNTSIDNGGAGGYGSAASGGKGGTGGYGSWFYISNEQIYGSAEGGAGGGGGGGAIFGGGKYSGVYASGGGGGGGRYYLVRNSNSFSFSQISVPGATGGKGVMDGATAGGNGDTSFNLYGGRGGKGSDSAGFNTDGGTGGTGAGAGGGGGNAHNSSHHYKTGGQGGGGAGGDYDAGGGTTPSAGSRGATNPSNVKTIPTDTLNENKTYGVNSNYGQGGYLNGGAGANGFILIQRVKS